ncbi:hypothetical protein ACFPT7_03980 [Acidicapsa dinghuensis]|uniref:Uncharacterized protein n=1 Tax=Acidicapsa dinghuensis TaxID=2218256 RepID=A0ABW1EAS0_9BACT|nr:hypothetical protein [Acidicapsa dinghuensis]
MTFRRAHMCACLMASSLVLCLASKRLNAQEILSGQQVALSGKPALTFEELPDAPAPQIAVLQQTTPASSSSSQTSPSEPQSSAGQSGSPSSATPPQQPQESQHQIAEDQLKQQKKQRVFGFLPSFNTSYLDNAVSLTAGQKFRLAFSQTTDPVQFGIAAFAAGLDEAEGGDYGYGGGPLGYGKRWGADYLTSFDGNMIGNALLPALLHQDPRFFRRGYGSAKRRVLYALATSFVCKHDVTGKWEPNYSNIGGNIIGGAISNFYVPKDDRGVDNVFQGFALVTVEGGAGAILQEFWPDISRKFFHKDPTNGHDAIIRAQHGQQTK